MLVKTKGVRPNQGAARICYFPNSPLFSSPLCGPVWPLTICPSRQSGLRKRYRCLVHHPPPQGTLEDWVVEDVRVPGLPAHSLIVPPDTASCHRCELQVVGVEQVALSGEAQTVWGDSAYEVDILLVTGRTHQVGMVCCVCSMYIFMVFQPSCKWPTCTTPGLLAFWD